MRKIASVSVCALIASLGAVGTATADTPGCVSKREFARVHAGMGRARVHQIFDSNGTKTGLGGENSVYYYRPCRSGGTVQVTYNARLRLVSKSGNWFS